jgi:hypothetical protein
MNNTASAIAVIGTDVYVGGSFTVVGGLSANRIAKWDGSAWSTLGVGMNDHVHALAAIGTDLYAGGCFTTAGGVPAARVAKWDGNIWSALGAGVNDVVHSLATIGADLYAAGNFTSAGGLPANRVAKWSGSGWSVLGSGMDSTVSALAVIGTDLYAGGEFTIADGAPATRLALWDGTTWSPMGSGTDGQVKALAVDPMGRLFVGGDFFMAGPNMTPFIAQAITGVEICPGIFSDLQASAVAGFSFMFSDGTIGQPYRVQSLFDPINDDWADITNLTYTGPVSINDSSVGSTASKSYRAITP